MGLVKAIKVEGLRELQASMRQADAMLPRQLRVALNEAAEIVADEARRRIPTRSGRARASVKTRSSQREAIIQSGGKRAPYQPWLEFGGRVGRSRSVARPFVRSGRYVWPAFGRERQRVAQTFDEAIVRTLRAAGIEVH